VGAWAGQPLREGASVVGCDVEVSAAEATVEMVRAASGTMVSLQPCHLTKPTDCQVLVDFAVRSFGRIDVLFNNAAMAYFNWLEDITDEEWNRGLREEIDLVFYLTRAAWPHLKTSHGVVNTASLNGLMSFRPLGSLAHTTAKAGIIGMTRQLAMEGREYGIRANSISPGLIETNQTREQLKDPEWAGYARQDAVGSSRAPGGSGKRGSIPCVGGELVRHRRRYHGRRRHEGLVIVRLGSSSISIPTTREMMKYGLDGVRIVNGDIRVAETTNSQLSAALHSQALDKPLCCASTSAPVYRAWRLGSSSLQMVRQGVLRPALGALQPHAARSREQPLPDADPR